MLKKEYGSAASTKTGVQKKERARRIPTSRPRKVATRETMKYTIKSEDEVVGQDKKKKRVRTTTAKVLGNLSMRRDSEEEEEEVAAPAPKAQKLMGDAIRSGAAIIKAQRSTQSCLQTKDCTKEEYPKNICY